MRHGLFRDASGRVIDEVLAVYMPAGQSFTGLEQVEVFGHGGRLVVREMLDVFLRSGARAAEPGEFTRLAFLSGRIDLSRAEAVAEVIGANTETSLQAAREHLLGAYTGHIEELREEIVAVIAEVEASIDFPEEQIDPETIEEQRRMVVSAREKIEELAATYRGGRLIREGFKVAIGGRPNAGKSSLFNRLLRQERALVTPTPGTTRDYLSEWIDLGGFAVNLIDTAGIRKGGGQIERAGQTSARKIMAEADLVLWLADVSVKTWGTRLAADLKELAEYRVLVGGNKVDLAVGTVGAPPVLAGADAVFFSCKTGEGMDQLTGRLTEIIREQMPDLTSGLVVTSARHRQKLSEALEALHGAEEKLTLGESPELVAFDLRQAAGSLAEITGRIYNEDILGQIFAKFCIGK